MKKISHIISITLILSLLLFLLACENKSVVRIDVDKTAPTVSITSPVSNATLYGTISISIQADDNVGVVKLEIYIDGVLTMTDDNAPWEYTWDTTLENDGNHTLFAKAYDAANNVSISSTINVTIANSFEVTFNNQAFTEIELTVAGQGMNRIDAGSNLTLTYSINPGSLACTGETSGKTSSGSQIGEKIIWDFTEDVSGKSSQTFNLVVDSDWFFIFVRNNGTQDLSPFYVNYNTSYQTRDDILIPADGTKYQIGYYRAFSNTEIRAYWYNSSSYSYWIQGTNFTLLFTDNQSVTLVNTSLQLNSVTNDKNIIIHNKKYELVNPEKPKIYSYKNLQNGKIFIGRGIE